jgi:DNA primase
MDLVELLNHRGIEYRKTNNPEEILISCTSGEHVDKSPSLSYNLEKNVFHCWSCGFSGGITKFMVSIGETIRLDVDSKQPYKLKKLKDKIRKVIELDEIHLPEERHLYAGEFKGISGSVMKEFQAFTTQHLGLKDYICIPVYQFGKLKFIEGRYAGMVSGKPKYYRRPQGAGVADILFPLDKVKNTNYVILVEGIFDMLNMWQLGYKNTLCIFGASNFSRKKLEILDRIGVTRVDILMDPDAPGQMAASKIANALDTKNISSRNIKLPVGIDAGDLNQRQAEAYLK